LVGEPVQRRPHAGEQSILRAFYFIDGGRDHPVTPQTRPGLFRQTVKSLSAALSVGLLLLPAHGDGDTGSKFGSAVAVTVIFHCPVVGRVKEFAKVCTFARVKAKSVGNSAAGSLHRKRMVPP
jgi:hypothetical protein